MGCFGISVPEKIRTKNTKWQPAATYKLGVSFHLTAEGSIAVPLDHGRLLSQWLGGSGMGGDILATQGAHSVPAQLGQACEAEDMFARSRLDGGVKGLEAQWALDVLGIIVLGDKAHFLVSLCFYFVLRSPLCEPKTSSRGGKGNRRNSNKIF